MEKTDIVEHMKEKGYVKLNSVNVANIQTNIDTSKVWNFKE